MSTLADGPPLPDTDFEVDPYSPREVRFHVLGGVLNGLAWLTSLVWIAATWRAEGTPSPWGVALALLLGIYLADLASGILHWAFDTWFDEGITFVRRMVLQVREHHVFPHRIFKISFTQDAGTLSWIAWIVTMPFLAWALLAGGSSRGAFYALVALAVWNPLLVFMLEFHKCGHRAKNPWWVRILQEMRIVLSVKHHIRHHSGNHDVNYCIINGWADRTLGRLGFFRFLEWGIEKLTGAVPQRNDHEWLRRYGRRQALRAAEARRRAR